MSSGRHIYLYRKSNDGTQRQKVRFTVDDGMNIIAEEPCHENGIPYEVTEKLKAKNLHTEAALAASPQLQQLRERGIKFHMAEGKIHLDAIPPLEIKIAQFFVPDAECPFAGCEKLRKLYLEELRTMKNGEQECSACDVNTLQLKYRKVVIQRLESAAIDDSLHLLSSGNTGVS